MMPRFMVASRRRHHHLDLSVLISLLTIPKLSNTLVMCSLSAPLNRDACSSRTSLIYRLSPGRSPCLSGAMAEGLINRLRIWGWNRVLLSYM